MLMLKHLSSALAAVAVLSLGTYSVEVAAKPHGPYVSKHQCQAAYQAFDDFDHGKFRRR